MGIFNKREKDEDSVYARRLARGEVQEKPVIIQRPNEMQELRKEIRELKEENRRLRKEIDNYQKQLKTMDYVHNIDVLIDTMREEKANKPQSADLFGAMMNWKPKPTATSSSDDNTTNMLSPENNSTVVEDIPDDAQFEDDEISQEEIDAMFGDDER